MNRAKSLTSKTFGQPIQKQRPKLKELMELEIKNDCRQFSRL
jgi:hypothetical protein